MMMKNFKVMALGGAAEKGDEGQLGPGPQGLRSLISESFNML